MLPDAASLDQARTHGMPPLAAQSLSRDAAWHGALYHLLMPWNPANAATAACGGTARTACRTARSHGRTHSRHRIFGPRRTILSLGWQRHCRWSGRSASPACRCRPTQRWTCATSARPVAACPGSVIGAHADVTGLRYAQCSLCGTQWNVTRASCLACGAGEDRVGYHSIEGDKARCRPKAATSATPISKLLRRDQDASADLTADDLASLALDMLLDDAGFARGGPNLLFVPGNPERPRVFCPHTSPHEFLPFFHFLPGPGESHERHSPPSPAVDRVLQQLPDLIETHGRQLVTACVRRVGRRTARASSTACPCRTKPPCTRPSIAVPMRRAQQVARSF